MVESIDCRTVKQRDRTCTGVHWGCIGGDAQEMHRGCTGDAQDIHGERKTSLRFQSTLPGTMKKISIVECQSRLRFGEGEYNVYGDRWRCVRYPCSRCPNIKPQGLHLNIAGPSTCILFRRTATNITLIVCSIRCMRMPR